MNRTLVLGIAVFLAALGIAVVGGEKQAVAGHGCGGCWDGCGGCWGGCGGCWGHRCHGCFGGLLANWRARRCHGCWGGCGGCGGYSACCGPPSCCQPCNQCCDTCCDSCGSCDSCNGGNGETAPPESGPAPVMAPNPNAAALRGNYSFRSVSFRR